MKLAKEEKRALLKVVTRLENRLKTDLKDKLIADILKVLYELGNDHMARIDARLWAEHFSKKIKKMNKVKKLKI